MLGYDIYMNTDMKNCKCSWTSSTPVIPLKYFLTAEVSDYTTKVPPNYPYSLFLSVRGFETEVEKRAFNPHLNQTITWKLENNIEILFKDDSLNIKAEKAFRKTQEYSYSCEGSKDRSYTYLKA